MEEESLDIPDGIVSSCIKTNNKIRCKASKLSHGEHNVKVTVKDKAGNRCEKEGKITVTDKVAPVIDSINASTGKVTVKYHDPLPSKGIASLVVYVDGVRLNCETGGAGCDNDHDGYDDDHDGYDNDHHGYYLDSYAAGNNGTATFTVTVVDTTGPIVTYGGPNDTVIMNDSPAITGTATDSVGVVSALVSIDGGAASACTIDSLGNVSCPTTGLAFGYHTAIITATDAAGNTGSATGVFCKSSGAPYLTIICPGIPPFPSADFYWKDKPNRIMTIVYTFSDEVSPGAYNVKITASSGNSNAGALVNLTPLPRLVGDVIPGSPVKVALDYYWPVGVTSFNTVVTACADDQCGNTYWEAPPGIPTI